MKGWTWDGGANLRAVARHATGVVVVQYQFADGDGLRLVVHSYEHHLTADAAKVAPVPLAWLEERANVPGAALALLDHRDDVSTGGVVSMALPGAPKGTRKPNSFYERVAFYTRQCQEHGIPAARRLAEDNGVPLSTATRWIREARRRKLLEPSDRGKA
jgi:hypothetical protein